MDLNERLAQRRKEREIESAALAGQIAKEQHAKELHIKNEALKQVTGVESLINEDPDLKTAINKEADKILEKMAVKEINLRQVALVIFLIIIGLGFFQKSWVVGVAIWGFAAWYFQKVIDEKKMEIIKKRKSIAEAKELMRTS